MKGGALEQKALHLFLFFVWFGRGLERGEEEGSAQE